jgi:hypothetical protein
VAVAFFAFALVMALAGIVAQLVRASGSKHPLPVADPQPGVPERHLDPEPAPSRPSTPPDPPRYAPSAFARIEIGTDVDGAALAMRQVFPSVNTMFPDNPMYEIPLDHPLFRVATLKWENRKGGRLSRLTLREVDAGASVQAKIEQCLRARFGPGHSDEDNHLKGTHSTRWELGDGQVAVDDANLSVNVAVLFKPRMGEATWQKLVATLDACGRS